MELTVPTVVTPEPRCLPIEFFTLQKTKTRVHNRSSYQPTTKAPARTANVVMTRSRTASPVPEEHSPKPELSDEPSSQKSPVKIPAEYMSPKDSSDAELLIPRHYKRSMRPSSMPLASLDCFSRRITPMGFYDMKDRMWQERQFASVVLGMLMKHAYEEPEQETTKPATNVEMKVNESEMKVKESEMKVKESEMKVKESEMKVKEKQLKTNESEMKVNESEMKVKEKEMKTNESEMKANESEMKTNGSEKKEEEMEAKESKEGEKSEESKESQQPNDEKKETKPIEIEKLKVGFKEEPTLSSSSHAESSLPPTSSTAEASNSNPPPLRDTHIRKVSIVDQIKPPPSNLKPTLHLTNPDTLLLQLGKEEEEDYRVDRNAPKTPANAKGKRSALHMVEPVLFLNPRPFSLRSRTRAPS